MSDKTRDLILVQSVVYRKTISQISTETGVSVGAVSKTISCYEAMKEEKWDAIAAKCNSKEYNATTLLWAEKATQKKIPQDVWDICFPQNKEPEQATEQKAEQKTDPANANKTDKIIEQNEQIIACLRAIADGIPQIMTSISYLDKRIKDEATANFAPLMGYVKTIKENLVGIKCNTRLLKNLEGK